MQWSRGEKLGSGASGTVYVAHVLQDQCSIKNGLPSNVMAVKAAEVERAGSLLKERKLLTRFQSCPHIIRCFGDDITDENGNQMYNLWLEYASGGSLADRLKRLGRGLSEDEVRKHTKSVLKGLRHLHMQGYVHCDLKPHNILLVQDDAKIADLGSAKKAGNTLKQKQGKPSLRGTPMYMAPESILQQDYQPETDIWALGCTVLQLITGKEPWKRELGMAPAALIFRIAFTDKVPEIPSARSMSSEAKDFLNKCLVRDPKSRWTADELLSHSFLLATNGVQGQSNKKALAVPFSCSCLWREEENREGCTVVCSLLEVSSKISWRSTGMPNDFQPYQTVTRIRMDRAFCNEKSYARVGQLLVSFHQASIPPAPSHQQWEYIILISLESLIPQMPSARPYPLSVQV